jgi:hypothetical protein
MPQKEPKTARRFKRASPGRKIVNMAPKAIFYGQSHEVCDLPSFRKKPRKTMPLGIAPQKKN